MVFNNIYLASSSPRRAQLLNQIGVHFQVVATHYQEPSWQGEAPEEFVRKLATHKAQSVSPQYQDRPILSADTLVYCHDQVFGKPHNASDAQAMLGALSGCDHRVYTGVCLCYEDQILFRLNVTKVRFAALTKAQILHYWLTQEPKGKAGAYAIQGYAASFIQHIEGSYSGVMGLPLMETTQLLQEMEVVIWQTQA